MKPKTTTQNQDDITPQHPVREEEFSSVLDEAMLKYALTVMEDRAIPDARDGLKPSQRRILVAMNDLHLSSRGGTKKSAKIAGDVAGNYHPHGDQGVYQAIVTLAQDWVKRYPLVHGQGNWGNIGGDSAAASRYTEAKLTRFGDSMLTDLSEGTVPYQPNYDESRTEPTVLPSVLPNLLVNGGTGIAVAVASNMAPHNLREVVAVIKAYIINPEMTVDDALELMPGPDFPTGGTLLGQSGVRDYYTTGRGSVQVEGVYEIMTDAKGREKIIISGVPFGQSPERLAEQIETLVKDKKIDGLSDMKDLSYGKNDTTVIRLEVSIDRKSQANLVLKQLLKSTGLRSSFSVNNTVQIGRRVIENAPLLFLVKTFIDHRVAVLTAKFSQEQVAGLARAHILNGLIGVTSRIDEVIKVVRGADSPEEAQAALIVGGFVQDEIQAKAVLALTLSKLTKLEAETLQKEEEGLRERDLYLTGVLGDGKKMLKLVSKEQEDLARVIGDDRRTVVASNASDISAEELIQRETIVISLTKDGYVKRLPLSAYRVQNRGGKGVTGVQKRESDEVGDISVASTHDFVLFFTNLGVVYRKKGYEIPQGSRTSKGTHLANLLALRDGETVTNTITLDSLDRDGFLVMVTRGGTIKRSPVRDYNTVLKSKGLQAIKLTGGDELAFVSVTDGKQDVFLATEQGLAVRYAEDRVRVTGRITEGVKAMNLSAGDGIAQMLTFSAEDNPDILVLTALGFGKKTESSSYRCFHGRNAKGLQTVSTSKERNGLLVAACAVREDDTLIILTTKGQVIQVPVKDIRSTGRTAMGVKVVNLGAGHQVSSVAKVSGGVAEAERLAELAAP